MKHTIPYGKSSLEFHLPDHLKVDVIAPKEVHPAPEPLDTVEESLMDPVGGLRLEDFSEVKSAAIAVNDKTRPVPHQHLLPPLLDRLKSMGVKRSKTIIFIATGTHPPMVDREFREILPADILARYRVVSHDASLVNELAHLGNTSRGTPISLNKRYYQADLRIVVGNIEPHQFQGFSGGVKSAVIGLAGKGTIDHNHAMMIDPKANLGRYADNPARQDLEEIGRIVEIHYALNAVLNDRKQIVHVLAGDPQDVMHAGIPLARDICQVKVDKTYDLAISSPGGHPKDINLYQSQKGLAHTRLVTRQGGSILLAAACPDGSGSSSYEHWMEGVDSFQEVFDKFKHEGFRVGPHKAYQIARAASWARVYLYSEMNDQLSWKLLLKPVRDFQDTIEELISALDLNSRIAVMPYASSTIPYLHENTDRIPG